MDAAVGDVVYVSYVSCGLVHQLLVRIEYADAEHVEVRVADPVDWHHVDCAGATLEPKRQPRVLKQDPTANTLIRLPLRAILRRFRAGEEEPVYVLCTPSLKGRLAKLTLRNGYVVGRVVRDLWRAIPFDRSCVIALTPKELEGRSLLSHKGDVVFKGSYCYFYDGCGPARLQTSTIADCNRGSIVSLRQRYMQYLLAQVALYFGGMSRHVVSAFKEDKGDIAFTYSDCYLTPMNRLSVELGGVGTSSFLSTGPADVTELLRLPRKGDVVYGKPTAKSIAKPHRSGRETLLWINVSHYPGLDVFLRFLAQHEDKRAAAHGANVVAAMCDAQGKPTVFSELMAGYYAIPPAAAADTDSGPFQQMMDNACWEYNL